jgi:hypothetical protein
MKKTAQDIPKILPGFHKFMKMQKNKKALRALIFLVPKAGVEPARDHSHRFLRPTRLPIPPLRQLLFYTIIYLFLSQVYRRGKLLLNEKLSPD